METLKNKNEVNPLFRNIRLELGENILNRSGGVFGSPARTLKEGQFYLVGLNPGQHGMSKEQINKWTIKKNLEDIESNHLKHNITETTYPKKNGDVYNVGEAPFQMSARSFFNAIGVDLDTVCYSNLYFIRTKDEKELNKLLSPDLIQKHIQVHKLILDVVKPKNIVFFSSTAYYAFKRMFSNGLENENKIIKDRYSIQSGHTNKEIKLRKFELNDGKEFNIIWVPHLSRYKFHTLLSEKRNEIGMEILNYINK